MERIVEFLVCFVLMPQAFVPHTAQMSMTLPVSPSYQVQGGSASTSVSVGLHCHWSSRGKKRQSRELRQDRNTVSTVPELLEVETCF